VIRMFGITAFYHRYFSHKTFQTSRVAQFCFAVIGASATQRGPLWWAANHRHHHVNSDKEKDIHSPKQSGFLWSHMGWFLCKKNFATKLDRIQDFAKFPELSWLDRYDVVVPVLFATFTFILGSACNYFFPSLGTSGWQMLVWAYRDESRNNLFLAVITLGEGWHNNHHKFPGSARQGLYWWEFDISYYGILLLEKLGIVWDVDKGPSKEKVEQLSIAS